MSQNVASLAVSMAITYGCLIVLTLFGVSTRNFVCRNKRVKDEVSLEKILKTVTASKDLKKTVDNLMYKSSDEALEKYKKCLNRSLFYLSGIGFFLGGLVLGLALERTGVLKYAVIPPALFFLFSRVGFFRSLLDNLPDAAALPFLVSNSTSAIFTFLILSVLGSYFAYR
jgi:hypothetical protein